MLLISTGSQGEPLSALSRMSRGEHRQVNLIQGDTVILASSMIPGNETSVFTVINELARAGVTVVHQGVAKVHVSGHASAGELLFLYNAVRPKNVIPVHGEWRHLRAQARLAVLSGVPSERVVLAPDGTVVDLIDGRARISGHIDVGMVYVDGAAVGDVGENTLSDRLILGEGGFIAITVAIDAHTGRAVASPTISGRGFSDDPRALAKVVPLVEAELAQLEADGVTDTAPDRPGGPPGGRPLGRRRLPPSPDDRADRARRLTARGRATDLPPGLRCRLGFGADRGQLPGLRVAG